MSVFRNWKRMTVTKNVLVALLMGMACGFMLAYVSLIPMGALKLNLNDAHYSSQLEYAEGPTYDPGVHNHEEEFHNMEDTSVADNLTRKVRVLCWVMTQPKNHQKKARHVKNTWGKRCNILLFMSTAEDESLPAIALSVKEERDFLWAKTKEAFKYIYKHYLDKADWFLKADDDTFVILENLRYMLKPYNTSDPIYFGCRFKQFVKQGYMSGGAGYVLSREAVKRFIEMGLHNATHCYRGDRGSEDVELGKCMEAVHVKAGDSRDSHGRGRFFPFVPEHHLIPGHVSKEFWYWKYIYYDSKEGMECCSDNAVSFHYVSPNQMYVLEYLIYHLRPYGITYHVTLSSSHPDGISLSDKDNKSTIAQNN
ncbi:glycoprotein-N-acetylgalactosamine 3-beta-galactosyltransferase 1-like isoform X2 [Agrilus planipennis]|uniref:Glycoprotein-N-acetylgalactosamine 3-beta-galactosyltransferase 1 n=1 Tax=Agrilus planipennis TaxID=224129 RepID=A0A7F5R7F8_AGRPL|nr:glycoprotein-N-acetylgalactosamine 3-beta-galactosyltransferase 1-like isoform X2 [Agrilus planipennis]